MQGKEGDQPQGLCCQILELKEVLGRVTKGWTDLHRSLSAQVLDSSIH